VGAISTPIHNMVSLLNKAWEQDPFADFFFTDPEGLFDEVAVRYEEFDGALEDLAPSNYTSLITKAVFAVTGASSVIDDLSVSLATSAPSTPQTLFANFATTARTEIAKFLAAANTSVSTNISALLASAGSSSLNGTSLVAATTLWKSLVSAATATLGACDFPKEVSVPAIINMAAANAKDNLKSALKVVEQIISGSIVDDLVTAFQTRRETAYEQEVAQFAGGMADINAVNSSAFLFGVALLRSEQQRSVAEFDAQINFQVLQQGLSNYISLHSAQLQVSAQAAI